MAKPNSCSNCSGSVGSPTSSGDCRCGCPSPICDPDPQCRLLWCEQASLCEKVNPFPNTCTLCNLNVECNIFYEDYPSGGRCILDEMTFEQVITILSRNPHAKEHMLKITSDPCLIKLANQISLVTPLQEQNLSLMRRLNESIPFYTLYKGNINGTDR